MATKSQTTNFNNEVKTTKPAEKIETSKPAVKEEKPFVRLVNVNKVYDKNVHAVFDFNLDIKSREFIAFVGPSGCGKSTTLRMIAGLEDITSGEFWIGDKLANNLPSKDRDIAMVFQNYALYPNMSVYKNMAFSLSVRHTPRKEIKERVLEAAKILELEDYLERKPKALSGGQRQRVALGRAIVRKAQLFLMDEPLSNLDAKLRVQMRSEIIKLHKKLNTTTIYVTHDQIEAMTMADRIVVMKAGHIQQVGTPLEIYRHPANKFVASFIGSPAMNFANATYDKGTLTFSDGNKIKLESEIVKEHDAFYIKEAAEVKNEIKELEDEYKKTLEENDKYQSLISKKNILEAKLKEIEKIANVKDNKHVAKADEKEVNPITNDQMIQEKGRIMDEIKANKNHIDSFFKENKEIIKITKKIDKKKELLKNIEAINAGEKHEVTFGIRPESIKRVDAPTATSIQTTVKLSELLGNEYYVHFDFGGRDLLAKVESENLIQENDKIILEMKHKKIHLFDIESGKTINY